jgi:predicted porin
MGGSYTLGPVKASLGYVSETMMTATPIHTTNKYLFGGLKYTVTPLLYVTGAYYAFRNSTANVSGREDVSILSAVYSLSKRTQLYADIDNTHFTGVFLHNATLNASGRSNSFGASAGINVLF